ncbi:MAG: hypothetical protein KIG36_05085 [Eubacteriales bacterium]|nr:hypothetical protein [Eubacteriales bacterium]
MQNYNVPNELKPLSPWAYFGLNILYAIPIVGFIFLLCHAIGAANVNKRNFARSFFCVLVVVLIIFGIILLTGALTGAAGSLADWLKNLSNP